MRDPKRIYEFCHQLAEIWVTKAPDWRFGQLMSNILGAMQSTGQDPFLSEEDEILDFIKKYFNKE